MDSLRISRQLWRRLVNELKRRGRGCRESGAFLLGKIRSHKVSEFVCYDDLDPNAFDTGIIVFRGQGLAALWEHCRTKNLRVLADIHTHCGDWTGQSNSDRCHPLLAQQGHIALIVPRFAQKRHQGLNGIGIHEYRGSRVWQTWDAKSQRIKLTLI